MASTALRTRSVTRRGTMPPSRCVRADGVIWRVQIEYNANAGNIFNTYTQGADAKGARKTHIICRAHACGVSVLTLRGCTTESWVLFPPARVASWELPRRH